MKFPNISWCMAAGFANLGSTSLAKRLGFFLLQHGLQDLLGADGSNRRDLKKKKCGNPSKSIPVKSTVKWVYHWFINLVTWLGAHSSWKYICWLRWNGSSRMRTMRTSDPPALVSHRPHRIQRKDIAVLNLNRAKRLKLMFCQDIVEFFGTHKWAGIRKTIKLVQDQVLHPTSQISFPNRRYNYSVTLW